MAIRVLLADDHDVVREGPRMFLGIDPELTVIGEAADGEEAVHLARQLRPDVVLMDSLMPVMDGIAAIAAIRHELPDTEVIALPSVLESDAVVRAVQGLLDTSSRTPRPPNCAEPSMPLPPGKPSSLPRHRPTSYAKSRHLQRMRP